MIFSPEPVRKSCAITGVVNGDALSNVMELAPMVLRTLPVDAPILMVFKVDAVATLSLILETVSVEVVRDGDSNSPALITPVLISVALRLLTILTVEKNVVVRLLLNDTCAPPPTLDVLPIVQFPGAHIALKEPPVEILIP